MKIPICALVNAFLFLLTGLMAQDPVTTDHQVVLASGDEIAYSVSAGYLDLKTEQGEDRAHVFYIAYELKNPVDLSDRPITFVFNGGPGSSSVWLHMGALGPKRVYMTDEGAAPDPPYNYGDNPYTWLEFTDLVFIDPVMTGFSRPAKEVDKKEFLGYEEDIEAVGEFIRLFLTKAGRWSSPKYLAGESYGTTRASGLTGHLQDRYGLYLNGIVLISHITNFQTARFTRGNDLPYPLFLPTYSATAWYHDKLDPAFTSLEALLDEVEEFALTEYNTVLMKGDLATEDEVSTIADKLARYTGLSREYVLRANLRPVISRFVKELRREEGITVGRLDSRFAGVDYDDTGERYEFDPSYNKAIYGPFTTAVYDYLTRDLGFESDIPYEILTGRVRPWNYDNAQNAFLNVSETLREAMHKNPGLQVLVANGYYDLATPYFATEYTFNHLALDPALKKNISMTYYEAGHMMYIHKPSLVKFTDDVRVFYQSRNKS